MEENYVIEEEKMTCSEAFSKIEEQEENIRSAYGTICFNKRFFQVCTGVSLVSGVIGTTLLIVSGPLAAPIIATSCGIAGTVVGAIGIKVENNQRAIMDQALAENEVARNKVIEKSCKVR